MFLRTIHKLLACCALLLWAVAVQAAPAAGAFISNTALASYVDSTSGSPVHLTSNTVNTQVTALEALTLAANQYVVLASGAPFAVAHTLTNTGNADTIYQVAVSTGPASGFAPLNLQVIRDVNGNGRADPGEPVVDASGIDLPPGASVNLLVTGQLPATASPGQVGQLLLTATSQGQGAHATNTDTLAVTSGAAVQALLSASTSSATPGAPIDWTAVAVDNGSTPAAAVPVTIDGVATTAFVLRAPVPANATFVSATSSSNVGARTVYHLAGSAASTYVTAVPGGSTVDAVGWAVTALPAGGSLQGQFRVVVNANAAGSITDTAYADWLDQGVAQVVTSNTVVLPLPARAPAISFYTASTYATPALQNTSGQPLYVQADAAMCNSDPGRIDTVPVKVTSQLTGDVETFIGVETGPNTGVFRIQPDVPTANAATRTVAAGDGILEVLRNDVVTATIASCGGVSAAATTMLLIDPSGVVFDSRSNQPLAGATVQLIDVTGGGNGGHPGQPAAVLQLDGVTPAPASVVTGADGSYEFPLVTASTYRLRVTPPTGFVFPSVIPAALQPTSRLIDTPGSYGGNFSVAGGAVHFDVPLDTGDDGGIFVQKTANKASAEVGDFVDYTVTVKNVVAVTLPQVQLDDLLPAGFAYVRGSARLDAGVLADPAGGAGPHLTFALGPIAPGAQRTLTYRVRIGAGSLGGNGINTAQASGSGVVSNHASARVQVAGGVFSSDAYVIGKVFADCRRDGVQSAGDPGIPGVRIYLEDGTYAVTDEEGKYSFYGLSPRTHVAKVDRTTLPAGTTLRVLANRNAFDAGSLFVGLKNGELHKADFAVAECDAGVREQIAARRKALANPAEIVQAAGVQLSATSPGAGTGTDARTLPASGTLGLPGATHAPSASAAPAPAQGALPSLGAVADTGGPAGASQQGLPRANFQGTGELLQSQAGTAAAPPAPAQEKVLAPLEDLLPQLSAQTGFIGLADGEVMPTAQTRVRVKGPLGASFELLVNGKLVPATQVGKKSSLEQTHVTAWEYIGVDLRPGRNTLQVKAVDGFGNVRGSAELTLRAPGALARVHIQLPEHPVADAATPIPVVVSLLDAEGLPVTARTQVTLRSSVGEWQVTDTDPHQPGTQVLVEGGTGRFLLMPPAQPGKAEVGVLAGTVKASVDVEFMPALRPLIAAGIVEGTINLRNLNPSALQPAQGSDVFEREIQSVSRGFDDGKGSAAARAAVFLKGKVLGSSLLTLAYDSDKASDTRLFRDIQPNQFYPVYGDSSARGFDGQSTGKLYVLLQNGSNYALLGDFTTQGDNPARQLTQYSRALNGAKTHWSNGTVTLEGFASRTSATQVVQEFRADGTSGPFRLNLNGVANSEQVHVITRSRDQLAVVLKDTPLVAFTDYAIESTTGLLFLKAPVPSLDADLNPVFVRVSYDVDSGGPRHTVAGGEASVTVVPGTTVSAVAVHDDDPANRQQLQGLTLTSRLGEKTVVTAEAARSQTDLQGTGHGERADLRHDGTDLQAHVWGVHTDAGFFNTGSPQTAGQSEYGAKVGYNVDASNRIVGEALKTANSTTGAEQVGAELRLEHSLPGNAKIEVGVRHSSANVQAALAPAPLPGTSTPIGTTAAPAGASTAQAGYTSVRAKVTVPVPGLPQADMYGAAEQAIDGSGGREIGVGANYALNANTKIYARHDFTNSLNGPYTLSPDVSRYSTVAGVNTVLPDSTQLFNEYRVGDAVDGRTSEAAVGLRRTVQVATGLNVSATLQRIKPLSGPVSDDSTAVTFGAEYTAPKDWKASGQAQWQTSSASRSWLLTGAVVNKLDPAWTLLNRVLYNDQASSASAGGHKLVTAQSGVAYRPVDSDRWNALGRIEYKRDSDTTTVTGADESAWILSTHLNVQPSAEWVVSARYAAKLARDRSNGLASTSFTQLLGARSTWDITDRWDVGVQAYTMWGNGTRETALGLEIGYLAAKNLWVSAGYNIKGFSARDLAGDATTGKGVYMRLRYKFDETLLDGSADAAASQQAGTAASPDRKP